MEIPILQSLHLGALEALGTSDAHIKLMVLARVSPRELVALFCYSSVTRGHPSTSYPVRGS